MAGFSTKVIWIKAIVARLFISWPKLTVNAVMKHFLEFDKTQKDHMLQQKQGGRSTKCTLDKGDNTIICKDQQI